MSYKIWELLYPYIADEHTTEPFSTEMAKKLCEDVLPKVWDSVLGLKKALAQVRENLTDKKIEEEE